MTMGIEDKSGELIKQVSMSAIRQGRDPSDAEFQREIQLDIAREIKYGNLDLARMESQGMLAITERTGRGMEEVARAMARLEEAEGAQKSDLIQREGAAMTNIEQSAANMRSNIGMGMGPGMMSMAQGFQGFQDAQAQQRLANAGAGMGSIFGPVGLYSADRYAQPTNKETTPFDWAGFSVGLLETSMETAGQVMSSGGGMGAMAAGSDINMKKEIRDARQDIQDFMDHLESFAYKYTTDIYDGGEHYGVMAQDVERSKVGKTIVLETDEGKYIHMGLGFGALLASVSNLNERLRKLESN
jgi:hypothetical protein